ncbi:unnamed protein product [Amoebophrya sp. A25]|nr:unnamed protein product [Amoebophrya sp. A25]|eukprot:GSA25T00012693001.1
MNQLQTNLEQLNSYYNYRQDGPVNATSTRKNTAPGALLTGDPHGPNSAMNDQVVPKSPANRAQSEVTFSSVSSDDSLPLGCEHTEYFWIKRYRALKRKVNSKKDASNIQSIQEDVELELEESGGNNMSPSRLKRLPCTRFYLESRADDFSNFIASHLEEVQGLSSTSGKPAMLRTQDTLVISNVSSRWFVVDAVRPMRLLVGATTEGHDRLQPADLSRLKVIPVDLTGRGDRVKLLVTPSLGYAPAGGAVAPGTSATQSAVQESGGAEHLPSSSYRLSGDLTVFVNDVRVAGKFEHEFGTADQIFGIAIWLGNLSDVKLVEY